MKRYIFCFTLLMIASFGYSQVSKTKQNTSRIAPPDDGGDCTYCYQWNRDLDGDGFGNPSIFLYADTKPIGYVDDASDCNDSNPSINPNTVWYRDADGDGYGTSATKTTQCTQPTGYVLNSSDYNDTTVNITNIAPQNFYRDADGDTFGNPGISVYYSVKPAGYVTNSTDCNDSDVSINPATVWYRDADGDGYGVSSPTLTQCTQPAGYVRNSSDYNDTTVNITNIAPQTFYRDADGDTFGNPGISVYYSVKPAGYVTNNSDCDDTNNTITIPKNWYADNDGDGFGDPNITTINCVKPTGYVSNNQDECPTISGTILGCIIPSSSPTSGFGNDQNYILTITPKKPVTSVQSISNSNDVVNNITYFDGLGRPMQKIENAQSNQGTDIVTHIEYDAYGRQVKEYLPYPASQNSMVYIAGITASNETISHYQNDYNDSYPFSEKLFEASPLDRVLEQGAPGYDWSFSSPAKHTIRMDYQTNTSADVVKLFKVTTTWNSTNEVNDISINSTADYAANELYKYITKNENWTSGNNNTTEEFKDKEGRVVLKRTYADIKDANGNITEAQAKHDTYYIYNQYGNLTYVIPPLANGAFDQNTLDGLCYQYKYDHRNRLVEKKLPGKQWEYIVYDKLDRVVATGPALSPFTDTAGANGWLITKYDIFSRPILTAWTNLAVSASQRGALQTTVNGTTTQSETKTTAATSINNVNFNYTTAAWPTAGYHVLTVNYYDDYVFPHAEAIPATNNLGQAIYYNNTRKPKGSPTGSWVRVPETASLYKAETSITYYDYKSRPIRTKTINHLGGYTQVDSQLDFMGKTLVTETRHKRLSGDTELLTKEEFTYSTQDRLLTHTHQINGGAKQLLAKNTYDELGQLIAKNVGGTDVTGTTSLQKVDYKYNIRGWLKAINDVANLGTDLFAFKISYNDPITTSKALYNGNISETYWKTVNGNHEKKYEYDYDHLNRLTNATYFNNSNVLENNSFNESLSYDKNGNILTLRRNEPMPGGLPNYNLMDDLIYTYDTSNKNQLKKVDESPNGTTKGFKNGLNTDNDYAYDANGNMTIDKNKGITTAITYNHLNLPIKINFSNGNIEYLYNATGQKIQKKVTQGSTITTIDYLGGFQYNGTVLDFFPHIEGYVKRETTGVYTYVFNYTDHLGNVRVSYKKNGSTLQILEESNYYPFGLKHEPSTVVNNQPSYKYKYNGKEFQDELGLNVYAMDVRQYDPAIARWTVMDPVIHEKLSPYNAFDNNPVFLADPSGADAIYNWDTGKYMDGNKEVSFGQAMASHGLNEDGSEKESEETPPDDITVNSSGIVTNVVKNGKPNRFFDEKGKQLFFNDPKNDFSEIDSWSIGDRLFYPISSDELARAVTAAGLDPLMLRVQGKLGEAWLMAAAMSRGSADFSMSYLVQKYFTQGEKSYLENGTLRTSYNSSMHFFRFGDSKSIYNLYDAGNFMWGNWMGMNGFNYSSARFGSQANELGKDSVGDQRAIKNGYNFYKF